MKFELTDSKNGKHLIGEYNLSDIDQLWWEDNLCGDHPNFIDRLINLETEFGVMDLAIDGEEPNAKGGLISDEIEPNMATIVATKVKELIDDCLKKLKEMRS